MYACFVPPVAVKRSVLIGMHHYLPDALDNGLVPVFSRHGLTEREPVRLVESWHIAVVVGGWPSPALHGAIRHRRPPVRQSRSSTRAQTARTIASGAVSRPRASPTPR